MKSSVLDYQAVDGICTIALNRPDSLNSFSRELRAGLLSALESANADHTVRVIVIKGNGRGFCAGADLSEGLADSVESQLREEYKPFLMAIHDGEKPVIAQVHGSAAGIGAALAMVCDIVVMADDAYLYLAFAAIGLVPDGGLNWHLYHTLGPRRAYETIVEGKRLTAAQCLQYGICNETVPAGELEAAVRARAERLASGAPLAQAAVKRLLRTMGSKSLSETIDEEARVQQPLTESEDCRNAVAAFFAKEKPVFEGR